MREMGEGRRDERDVVDVAVGGDEDEVGWAGGVGFGWEGGLGREVVEDVNAADDEDGAGEGGGDDSRGWPGKNKSSSNIYNPPINITPK